MSNSSLAEKKLSVANVLTPSMSQLDIDRVSETPLLPLDWREIGSIFVILIKSGLPTAITCIANFLIPLVCLMFVGKYGTASELAGASLGNTLSNALSIAVFNSVNQGFGVISAHLFGAKKYKEVGLIYQRNLCVLGVIAIFSIFLMYFMDRLLLAVGLDYEVSINTGIYLRYLIPSIIGLNIYDCTRFYLTSQELFFFQGAVQFFISIVHIFWCMLFVGHLGLLVKGAAIAKSVSDILAAIILIIYVKLNKSAKRCSIPWTKKCLNEWWNHLKHALKIGGNTYVGWISLEISILIVSAFNDPFIIAAHGAAFTLANAFYALGIGNSVSMQAYIGNSVGEGHKYKAQKFMVGGLLLNLIYSLVDTAIMITLTMPLGSLFTNDERIIDIFSTMWFIYCLGHLIDTTSNHFTGIIRTVGKEKEALIYHFTSYVPIGLTCQWLFGVQLGYGYVAVWICIVSAISLMCILVGRETIRLDWDQVIVHIKAKIDLQAEIQEKRKLLEPDGDEAIDYDQESA